LQLPALFERSSSEEEKVALDVERANRSLFVQELLLSTFMRPLAIRSPASADRVAELVPFGEDSSEAECAKNNSDAKSAAVNGPSEGASQDTGQSRNEVQNNAHVRSPLQRHPQSASSQAQSHSNSTS